MLRLLVALFAAGVSFQAPTPATIELEIRVFDGSEDVTADTRVSVFKAGERESPLARLPLQGGRKVLDVPEGFYDVQAVRERDGRVVTIRWAERLVVMRYPDEGGRHLEVINLRPGFGALQIRTKDGGPLPELALFVESSRLKPLPPPATGPGYALFVLEAGRYDLRVGPTQRPHWQAGLDIPRDRTRLWVIPSSKLQLGRQATRRPVSIRATTTTSAMTSKM